MRLLVTILLATVVAAGACAQQAPGDALVTLPPPQVSAEAEGKHVVQDVTLSSAIADYTLRYEYVERKDDPTRITWVKWAPTIGYTPLGIVGPSECLWYNQGFFIWTFDDFNIQDYKAQFRVVRDAGQDAMVEYVWDTPKAKVTARFAITSGSDKLLFFGSYEPKDEIKQVKLRLMSYPATFSKPWVRSATTALRTLTSGSAELDLAKERWVLLEDTHPGRLGDGSAGLLLGDTTAFQTVRLEGLGGYAEYVDLTLAPGRRRFALGLYEFPSMPDPKETRAYFRRSANGENEVLAALATADLDQPLKPLPADQERKAKIANQDEQLLNRPSELWRPNPEPLAFSWASRLADGPVKVGLMCQRWAAWETMELGRRVPMDVRHLYFDTPNALVAADMWPYRNQTGVYPLSLGVAQRQALRVVSDAATEVFLITGVTGAAIPERVRLALLDQVRDGKGLLLAGPSYVLAGWPKELTAERDDAFAQWILSYLPWQEIPGLRAGDKGRLGEEPPLAAYRYGKGRVVVFLLNPAPYSFLVPSNRDVEGLDGAADRALALHALALLATAGRELPYRVEIKVPESGVPAATRERLGITITGKGFADALVRVQDDHDTVLALGSQKIDPRQPSLTLAPLPAGRQYFVDVTLRDAAGNCVGFGGVALQVQPRQTIEAVELQPSSRNHSAATPVVDLAEGGKLTCRARVSTSAVPSKAKLTVAWEISDCFNRVLARGISPVADDGTSGLELSIARPVTVSHRVDAKLLAGSDVLAVRRDLFTLPVPYPYDDFTFLMWSYPGGEPVVRHENRLCYDLGADMMDLCHMRGYTDEGAAREYELASRSGLRLVPYVTRLAFDDAEDHTLRPGLFDTQWLEREQASIEVCCRQAAPYRPAAYTLGDENYLSRGRYEVGANPETMAAFREWLRARYSTITALNTVWATNYSAFSDIERPLWIEEAATQQESYAAWFDSKEFLDSAFANLHEKMADFVRKQDPGAKVGWDGLLGYHWGAGYDFYKLTRNLELNQVYTTNFPQAALVRSFKRPGALTGEWGNAVADTEEGFSAIAWHNLFEGHNSCWWWTSWGCDYIPFNPDLSVGNFGRWYFEAAREIKAGPGKLLVHAVRDNAGIAVLYSQADLFAAKLASKVSPGAAFQPDGAWVHDHQGLLHAIEDLGYQYQYVAAAELGADSKALAGYQVLFLPLATCLSDAQVAAIREFVAEGGTVIADGRVGLLSENGKLRAERPLDDVFGVRSPAGVAAFAQSSRSGTLELGGEAVGTAVLEPSLRIDGGRAETEVDGTPVLVTNQFGKGRATLYNVPFMLLEDLRGEGREGLALPMLDELLAKAGAKPYTRLTSAAGRPRCVRQVLFVDGDLRYLGLQQDILQRGIPEQHLVAELTVPAYVYDMRAGRLLANAPITSWPVTVSRGRPALFALLPYRVTAVEAKAPATAVLGATFSVETTVRVGPGKPQFHVVHLSVYAPGSNQAHRQYSQNVACFDGQGRATIPFALNDPTGTWRLEFRDAASNVRTTATVTVRR